MKISLAILVLLATARTGAAAAVGSRLDLRLRNAPPAAGNVTVAPKTTPFQAAPETPAARAAASPEAPVAPAAVPPAVEHDYNDETHVVIWTGERLPLTVETLIALLWVTMVACMPLIVVRLEGGKTTQVQWTTFAIMWVTFLGGILLFTNVILFQSAHFDHVRPLTVVECVYLLSQILTTVGYGDITPAKPRGQVFIGIYVIMSLLIIANIVSEVSDTVTHHTREYIKELYQQANDEESVWRQQKKPTVKYENLIKTGCTYLFFVVLGVLFFTLYPGEGKTLLQAIYMSIITLSTVGFGWFTPSTEAGKVFAAFWMLFGSAALVALVGAFTEIVEQKKALERFCPDRIVNESIERARDLGERIDMAGFMKFSLLHGQLVSPEQVREIEHAFLELQPDSRGTVATTSATELLNEKADLAPDFRKSAFGLNPAHRSQGHGKGGGRGSGGRRA